MQSAPNVSSARFILTKNKMYLRNEIEEIG